MSGCVENEGDFYPDFDQIVLLTAPPDVIAERLTSRTSSPYGSDPVELAKVLDDQRRFEPLLRRGATDGDRHEYAARARRADHP